MDINNNMELVNTFLKGMNTDTSDMLLDASSYREARNLRPITDADGNTGEMRMIEGGITIEGIDQKIIASTTIRNIGVVIAVNNNNWWSVYKFNKESDTFDKNPVFGPCKEKIWDKEPGDIKLSLTTRWDSDENVKLYIADGIHKLMSVLLFPKKVSTVVLDLIGDTQYSLPIPQIELADSGYMRSGIIQYAYQLYLKYGNASKLSPISTPQIIYSANKTGVGKITTKSAKIRIPLVKNLVGNIYDRIKIYRINYQTNSDQPTVDVVYDDVIDYETVIYNDFGRSLNIMSIGEFNNITGVDVIPKCIEQKDNYLFAANIKYEDFKYADDWKVGEMRRYKHKTDPDEPDEYQSVKLSLYFDVNKNYELIAKDDPFDRYSGYGPIGAEGDNASWSFITKSVDIGSIKDKSLRRGELYRYGIIFYSNDGKRSSVKHIADIRVPDQLYMSDSDDSESYSIGAFGKVKYIGVLFEIHNFPDNCAGYEIVRCERTIQDMSTITQGVISYTMQNADNSYTVDNSNSQSPLITVQPTYVGNMSEYLYKLYKYGSTEVYSAPCVQEYDSTLLLFISPEISYLRDDIVDILKTHQCRLSHAFKLLTDVRSVNPKYVAKSPEDIPGRFNYVAYNPGTTISLLSIDQNGRFMYATNGGSIIFIGPIDPLCKISNSSDATFTEDHKGNFYEDTETNAQLYYSSYIDNDNIIKHNSNDNYHYNNYYVYAYYHLVSSKRKYDETKSSDIEISAIASPKINNFDDVIDSTGAVKLFSNPSVILNKTYINYVIGAWNTKTEDGAVATKFLNPDEATTDNWQQYTLLGCGGKSIILAINNKWDAIDYYKYNDNKLPLLVCNIKKYSVPYGGQGKDALDNSIYYGHGCYKELKYNENNVMTADSRRIDVYDGDTIILKFEYVHVHKWHSSYDCAPAMSVIYSIPLETSINLPLSYGLKFDPSKEFCSWIQVEPAVIKGSNDTDKHIDYVQEEPMYQYNMTYSSEMTALKYTSISDEDLKNDTFDCRVVYSKPMEQNELQDSWKIFQSANYLDVDSNKGQLTGLRLFNDKLVFWQEDAFGILSVNERQLVLNADDTTLMLGTGNTLLRFDYVTTEYGMNPNEYVDTRGGGSLYWWDHNRKELLSYGGKLLQPLVSSKGLLSYIRNAQLNDNPTIAYDYKYNEVVANILDYKSLVFNTELNVFTAIYDLAFHTNMTFDDRAIFTIGDNVMLWNKSDSDTAKIYNGNVYPYLKYVVNKNAQITKTFDQMTFGGRFYGGDDLSNLSFIFKTPLKLEGRIDNNSGYNGESITNREYDFKLNIPRAGYSEGNKWKTNHYGDRLKGKFMQCELSSNSNSLDFSLQYINTKFRISWI